MFNVNLNDSVSRIVQIERKHMTTFNPLANPVLEAAEKMTSEAVSFLMQQGVPESVATQRVERNFMQLNS